MCHKWQLSLSLFSCAAVGLHHSLLTTVADYFLVSLAISVYCLGVTAIPYAMLTVPVFFTQSSIFSLLVVNAERYMSQFLLLCYQVLMMSVSAVMVIFILFSFGLFL